MAYLFGARLKELRQAMDLTLEELAQKIDSSKGYLSDIENANRRPPSDRIIRQICRVLGADQKELLRLAHIDKLPPDLRSELMASEIIGPQLGYGVKNLAHLLRSSQKNRSVTTDIPAGYVPIINAPNQFPQGFASIAELIEACQEHVRFSLPGVDIRFALYMPDNSMQSRRRGVSFARGSLIFFTDHGRTRHRHFAFVAYPTENGYQGTFRRVYYRTAQQTHLVPLNPEYPTMVLPQRRLKIWKAIGCFQLL